MPHQVLRNLLAGLGLEEPRHELRLRLVLSLRAAVADLAVESSVTAERFHLVTPFRILQWLKSKD
jgi:hypothetical protein